MTEKLIILLTKAVEQEKTLTYGDIGSELGVEPIIVEKLFSEIDDVFKKNGLPPISTIVEMRILIYVARDILKNIIQCQKISLNSGLKTQLSFSTIKVKW